MLFLCYSRCSTCKKAQKWLDEQGIAYTQRDIKEDNPTLQELETWHQASALPLKKFFNTSGQLYRALSLSKKLPDMTQAEQYALLASDGMLVKRPILVLDDGHLVALQAAMEAKDYSEGYSQAHALKGVAGNLSFKDLYECAALVSDALYAGEYEAAAKHLPEVERAHALVIEGLEDWRDGTL